ncbi:MAG TPA: rubrerythrin family protein [Candidatus Omnitrophota bacterium]|nr:rubrerythrin family protein [Candidatus Omnitrophota bacterium]
MSKQLGPKTQQNLRTAFSGEAQARNKYTYFAQVARKEGYLYIAKIFEETAQNELSHAKDEFKFLNGLGDTKENLKAAMEGEMYETMTMYPEFAKDAEAEGHKDVAWLFKQIARVEQEHAERYKKLLKMVEEGTVYSRPNPIKWKCGVCGYIHEGTEPPPKCPCCQHTKEHFEPETI